MTYNDRDNADVARANADAEALRNDLNRDEGDDAATITERVMHPISGWLYDIETDSGLTIRIFSTRTYHIGVRLVNTRGGWVEA